MKMNMAEEIDLHAFLTSVQHASGAYSSIVEELCFKLEGQRFESR
jgi:hypothetical protein